MDRELFCKGYTWGFFSREGELLTDSAEQSMKRLASNGLDWICIAVNGWQETFYSTTIFSLYGLTQTDAEIEHAAGLMRQPLADRVVEIAEMHKAGRARCNARDDCALRQIAGRIFRLVIRDRFGDIREQQCCKCRIIHNSFPFRVSV